MTPINEMEELSENSQVGPHRTTPVGIDRGGDVDMEMEKMQIKLESADPVGDGDGSIMLSRAKEVQINIETETTTDSNPAPILSLTKISDDVASTVSLQPDDHDKHSVEFSEEKELSTRVYDFDMVKEKTLPRRLHLGSGGLLQFCSSQPKTHLLAWSLMGTSVVVSIIVFVVYWMVA